MYQDFFLLIRGMFTDSHTNAIAGLKYYTKCLILNLLPPHKHAASLWCSQPEL